MNTPVFLTFPRSPVRFAILFAMSGALGCTTASQTGRFALAFGTGSATIMCTACRDAGNVGGTTATIQFGQTVSQHVQIGGSADWWWHSAITTQGWDRWINHFALSLFYYPWTVRHGFFIEGGPAVTVAHAAVTDSTGLQRHGWGFSIGIGYDVATCRVVSLTPRLAYSYGWVGDIDYPLGTNVPFARGWKHEVVSLGLGITLHPLH